MLIGMQARDCAVPRAALLVDVGVVARDTKA